MPEPQKNVLDIYQRVTNTIIDKLEKGVLPWRRPWKIPPTKCMACNYYTGHEYRGINWLLLNLLSPYDVPYYLTWRQVKLMGGKVKKGSKAQTIYFYQSYHKNSNGKRLSEEEAVTAKISGESLQHISFMKQFNVFNITCTTGIEWGINSTNESKQVIEKCETLLQEITPSPKIECNNDRKAYYNSTQDVINMPSKILFNSIEDWYLVLFHELCHWTGHKNRLSREGIIRPGMQDLYAEEELIAELTACMLAAITGIQQQQQINNSTAYLQSWLNCLKQDKRFIFRVAPKAQEAVNFLLGKEIMEIPSK